MVKTLTMSRWPCQWKELSKQVVEELEEEEGEEEEEKKKE